MWWINFVRKVQWKCKSWRLQKICRELRLMIQLGEEKMIRAIRGAQAGLRRFARFQMWLIKKKRHLQRKGLVVPGDLSSKAESEVEADDFLQACHDLDSVPLETLHDEYNHSRKCGGKRERHNNPAGSPHSSDTPNSSCHSQHQQRRLSTPGIDIDGPCGSYSQQRRRLAKAKASNSTRVNGRRSRFNDEDSYSEFIEEQTSQRSAFLDFLFEDSPSPSRFLTTQALQNIMGCPTCREIVSVLPSDISITSRGYRPCEQCQGYSQTGKCLLCECSYGETKSLLLEKLTMSSWLRPCHYQSYGCQSLVGHGITEGEHVEEECKFKPLHCPFMLCRRKVPAAALIKHLESEHHLLPHDGPKCEGNIFCLGSNKRHGGIRPNYSLDPCAISCYGNTFILRVFRHSNSWYIWVWTVKEGEEGKGGFGEDTKDFPYTIRFRQSGNNRGLSESVSTDLALNGLTVPLRLTTEEIMDRGRCHIIQEQGSIFDCPQENDNSLALDFTLWIHPPQVPRPKIRGHRSKRAASRPRSY